MDGKVVRIAAITTVATLATLASYAVYFDYSRRNNPEFRKKLVRQQRKAAKSSSSRSSSGNYEFPGGRQELANALKRALIIINSEPEPRTIEEKEQYFMEQLSMGEQLALRDQEFYVAAAISFYKALKTYPAPHELAIIYQKTQPPAVFALVMELISLDASMNAQRSTDPRDDHSSALLTEVEPEVVAAPAAPKSVSSENGSSPSSGSYVHIESETVQVSEEGVTVESVIVDVPVVAAASESEEEDPVEEVAM